MRKFTKDDFDKLRQTLAAHLSERLIPEPENRELILNLIHDVQTVAADRANQILYEELAKCPVVYGVRVTLTEELRTDNTVMSWCEQPNVCERVDTHSAKLIDVKELER